MTGPTEPLVFLDTSALIKLLGCPGQVRLPGTARPVLHAVHLDEAIRRVKEAMYQVFNERGVDDECLERLAEEALKQVGARRRLPERRAKTEAAKLLNKLLERHGIDVVSGEAPRDLPECRPRVGSTLSMQDRLLLLLADQCHLVATCDDGILDCCRQLGLEGKCFKT